MKDRK